MKAVVYFNSMSAAGGIERVIAFHLSIMVENYQVILITKDECSPFFPLPKEVVRESLNIDFTMNMQSRMSRIVKIILSSLRTILALRQKIAKHDPHFVYVASPLNLLEVFLAGMNSRRIVVTEHSSFSAYNWIYKLIISKLYPQIGLLTVPTKLDSQMYASRGIRNTYLPNPIPFCINKFSDQSNKLALCVGRLTDDKRHDLLLDIWYLSGIHLFGWKLRIIGKGECELDLRKKIDKLGLNKYVFIEEPTSRIEDKYITSSIFLLTSRAEGFGLVLAEAMACGVPCISFDCPSGPRDIIQDGVTGRLLKEGDVSGYVAALQQLAVNPVLRQKYSAQGRLFVRKFHSFRIGRFKIQSPFK